MKATTISSALGYAGGLLVAIFFVALLSFIFSFLGTIFCAALAGLMLGTSRQTRWLALPVSLIFPAVIFVLLRATRAELSSGQINAVTALCGATFWLTYGLGFVVAGMERKPGKRAGMAQSSSSQPTPIPANAHSEACEERPATQPAGRLTLELLQGRWRFEGAIKGRPSSSKFLTIEKTSMIVTVADGKGEWVQGRAEISLSGGAKG